MVMDQLYKVLPPTNLDVRSAYERGTEEEQNFIQDLASFLCSFLSLHKRQVEKDQFAKLVLDAHFYMVCDEREREFGIVFVDCSVLVFFILSCFC
jgi:exportin-1